MQFLTNQQEHVDCIHQRQSHPTCIIVNKHNSTYCTKHLCNNIVSSLYPFSIPINITPSLFVPLSAASTNENGSSVL